MKIFFIFLVVMVGIFGAVSVDYSYGAVDQDGVKCDTKVVIEYFTGLGSIFKVTIICEKFEEFNRKEMTLTIKNVKSIESNMVIRGVYVLPDGSMVLHLDKEVRHNVIVNGEYVLREGD